MTSKHFFPTLAFVLLFTLCFLFAGKATAQGSDKILSVSASEGKEGEAITVTANLAKIAEIDRMYIVYRQLGQTEYKQAEMIIGTSTATGTIPASDVTPPVMEYYVILKTKDGGTETYPVASPESNPLQVKVQGISEKEREVIVLSPDRNAKVTLEELYVSVSLLRASSNVNKKATKLYIDDVDVSQNAVLTDDVLIYYPDNFPGQLTPGPHTVKVELRDATGAIYYTTSWNFIVATAGEVAAEASQFKSNVSLQLEARRENISNFSTDYLRGDIRFNGAWPGLRFGAFAHGTNEEKAFRQPQNRYTFNADADWLKVTLGDAYPAFPSLILNGKRVRGVDGSLLLGFVNVNVAYGQTTKALEGTVTGTDTLSKYPQAPVNTRINATNPNLLDFLSYGAYSRNLLAGRLSFGGGENFQLGFNYLHATDDTSSIKIGAQATENVVAGSDLLIAFDDHRFELTGQGALSITNNDIRGGELSDAKIGQLAKTYSIDSSTIADLKKIAKKFITFNQNLVPADPRKGGSLAYEGALALNYFDNYLKVAYIRRGPDYNSFGQTFLRKDVKGFTITDRLRLFENKAFLSGSYEQLKDNLQTTKFATTTFTNWSASLSVYPRADVPNFTVGYAQYKNENDVSTVPDSLKNPNFDQAINDLTNRVFFQIGYDFTAGVRQSLNGSVSYSKRTDETVAKLNTKNFNAAFALNTFYEIPLQTTIGLSVNNGTLPLINPLQPTNIIFGKSIPNTVQSDFKYSSLQIGVQYRFFEDRFRLFGQYLPTFGDYKRTLVTLGAVLNISTGMSLSFDTNFINNKPTGAPSYNDKYYGLIYRLNL